MAALLWGLIGILAKGALDAGVAPLEIAFWRAFIGGLLFCAHAGMKGELRLQRGRDIALFVGFACVGILHYVSFILAVDHGGVSLATILLASAPAFVVVGARILLRESLSSLKISLVIATLFGLLLVASGGGEGVKVSHASIFWGLLTGLTHASLYLSDKWMLGRYSPLTIGAFLVPLGALLLLPMVDFSAKSLYVWGLLILLGVFSTYFAYFLYYTGLKAVEASRAVLIASVEPVMAASLAAAIFGERFGPYGVLGAVLIFCSAALISLPETGLRSVASRLALGVHVRQRL